MKNDICFALRFHGIYRDLSVREHECYALKPSSSRTMIRNGKCNTKKCPFYKTSRADIRHD